MTAFFVPVPFLRVGSSTLISVRDTTFGKISAAATVSIAMPTNNSGDVVVGIIGHQGNSAWVDPNTPTGFTLAKADGGTFNIPNALVFYGVNPGTSVSYTNPSATRDEAYIFRSYSLVDTASPLSGTVPAETSTGNDEPNPPSITTSHNNAMVIAFGAVNSTDNTSFTAPSGYTELTVSAALDSTAVQSCVVMMANKLLPTAGAENPAAFTNSALTAGENTTGWTIALKPA